MIGVQTITAVASTQVMDFIEVKAQVIQTPTTSSHKKNKSQKKKKQSQSKNVTPIKDITQEIVVKDSHSTLDLSYPVETKENHAQQKPQPQAECHVKNEVTKPHTNTKQTKNKIVYVRKNPQTEEQQFQHEQSNLQPSIKKKVSSEEVKQPENVPSHPQKHSNTVETKKSQEPKDLHTCVIKSPTKTVKTQQQSSQEELVRLDAKLEDRISAESYKKAESSEDVVEHLSNNSTLHLHKSHTAQQSSSGKDSSQFKSNVFYTPQKKLKKKHEIQQYYYDQFSKRNGQNSHFQMEEDLIVNRNFTQSPVFTRQKENDEDVKLRRQEDRLKMLMEVLNPTHIKVNAFLDMGCGNCEISAEIGKMYGAKHIVGCDIYSEDQFVRPVDTPSSTHFTYIANRNDSLQPLEDKSLDLITCFMVLHHIENLDKNLRELQRVMKDGGYLYIREHDVPEENKELDQYLRYKHERFDDCGQFMKFWGKNDLKDKLDRFGFIHASDSLYSDNRPNRQKVYHSLFKFSLKHFHKMEELHQKIENHQNILPVMHELPTEQFKQHHSHSNKKKQKGKGVDVVASEKEKQEISVTNFALDSEEKIELFLKKQTSSEIERLSGDSNLLSDKSKTSILNNQSNNLFKTNSTSSTTTPNTTATSSSEDSICNNKTNPYQTQYDEIKERDSYKNRKQSPLVWRNAKKEQSLDNSEHSYNSKNDNNNIFSSSHHHHYQHHHHHHHHHANQNNISNGFAPRNNQNKQFYDNSNKYSKNPNYRFKNDRNDLEFAYKKHRKSQDFEFDDDEEDNFSSNRRQKEEWKLIHNQHPPVQPAQKKQKAPLKQAKPVQLIDILS